MAKKMVLMVGPDGTLVEVAPKPAPVAPAVPMATVLAIDPETGLLVETLVPVTERPALRTGVYL